MGCDIPHGGNGVKALPRARNPWDVTFPMAVVLENQPIANSPWDVAFPMAVTV